MNNEQAWNGRGRLTTLVEELERQQASKKDFVADSRTIAIEADDDKLLLVPRTGDTRKFIGDAVPIRPIALGQLAERVLPSKASHKQTFIKAFAEEDAQHCARFLTERFDRAPKSHLVRCLDGMMRSVHSDKFLMLDHYDVAFTALQTAKDSDAAVVEAVLTERSMRIKFVSAKVWEVIERKRSEDAAAGYKASHQWLTSLDLAREISDAPTDAVFPATTIYNSETGHGSYGAEIGILDRACINLAFISGVTARVHLGKKLEVGIFSDETRSLESRTIVAKARDSIKAAFTAESFREITDQVRHAQSVEIKSAISAVENIVKTQTAITEEMRDDLLRHFVDDYDTTAFGLASAVSRLSQDVEDADRVGELEKLAGAIIAAPEDRKLVKKAA